MHDRLRIIDATHLATDTDSDVFEPLVDRDAREVIADKATTTNTNHRHLQANGQRSSTMVKQNRVNPQVMGRTNPDSWRKRPFIECEFAEQKKYHGLQQARYWDLAKAAIQVLVDCMVVDCERMARRRRRGRALQGGGLCPNADSEK